MNGDQIQGTIRQVVLAVSATSAGAALFAHYGINVNDIAGFIGAMGTLYAFVWQLAHHRETGEKAKTDGTKF